MTTLFERLRDVTGLNLLTKYGDVFTITKNNSGTFNASTGAFTVTSETQSMRGKMFSVNTEFDAPEMVETAENEIFITASGISFSPQPGMLISESGATTPYTIVKVRRIPESGTAVIYQLRVRK